MDPSSVPKPARKAWDGHYYTEQQFRNHYGEHYITAWTQAQVSSDVSQSTRHPILSVAKPGPPPIPKTIPQPAGSVPAAPPLSPSPAPLPATAAPPTAATDNPLPRQVEVTVYEERLEALLSKALSVRETYQTMCHHQGSITDTDVTRPLDEPEMKALHNAWMNDTSAWMSEHCLVQYNHLLQQGDEINATKEGLIPEGNASKLAKGKGKTKDGIDKDKNDHERSPRQQAQQLKKQRFSKMFNVACKKALFMSFVRFPAKATTPEGIKELLAELQRILVTRALTPSLSVAKPGPPPAPSDDEEESS